MTNIQALTQLFAQQFNKQISTLLFDDDDGFEELILNFGEPFVIDNEPNPMLRSYINENYSIEHLGNQSLWLHNLSV